MEANFTQQDAFAVMHMTRLWRDLNAEVIEGNELLEERIRLLEKCNQLERERVDIANDSVL